MLEPADLADHVALTFSGPTSTIPMMILSITVEVTAAS